MADNTDESAAQEWVSSLSSIYEIKPLPEHWTDEQAREARIIEIVEIIKLAFLAGCSHARRWIPVSERLPEGDPMDARSGYCLWDILRGLLIASRISRGEKGESAWVTYDDNADTWLLVPNAGVTHWRPIEPPKSDEPKQEG